jgi:hypothetical protein
VTPADGAEHAGREGNRAVGALSPSAARILHLLHHHRLLSTGHVHEMVTPNAVSTRHVWSVLRGLHRAGLAGRVDRRGARLDTLWFATPEGAAVVEESNDVPDRAHRMDLHRATGPLQQHTLAVVDTGMAFLRHARRLGDDVDPLDWAPEIAHRFRDGPAFETTHLVADALLHYVQVDPVKRHRTQMQFLIEVDRATMPVARVAAKIAAYARYYDYVPEPLKKRPKARPAWRLRYPHFPRVLIILTGARRARLEHRLLDLTVRVAENEYLRTDRPGFLIGATLLEQLQEQGPTEPVFLPLLTAEDGYTDFLLTP